MVYTYELCKWCMHVENDSKNRKLYIGSETVQFSNVHYKNESFQF